MLASPTALWRDLTSSRPAPPAPASLRWSRLWCALAAGAALLHLILLLGDLPVERQFWLEWFMSSVRAVFVIGLGLWGVINPPWRPITPTEARRGPIIATIALTLTAVWCIVVWLNGELYTPTWLPLALWYVGTISLLLQARWLVRCGRVSAGALVLLGSTFAYIVTVAGRVNIGNEVMYVIVVLMASLLLRWWAGFVAAVALPVMVHLLQLAGLAPGEPLLVGTFFFSVLYLFAATIAGLYAHALEGAIAAADQRAEALGEAQQQLQAQHTRVQAQAAELVEHRSRLEEQVALRTAELQSALEDLRRNAVALRELQTPVVPVLPGVLVVPLIGALDEERAARFVADMLQAIERHNARAVLLDVTGLPLIDTHAARTLMQTASAVRLLGARMTLVGVAPETAQTIVGLGLDLSALHTERDLQSAVEHLIDPARHWRTSVAVAASG